MSAAVTISMNLSARQLQHPELAQGIARTILESGVDPNGLDLEITESVIMEDEEGASSKLKKLKSLGVQLTIDDFGTGYSSLSYLRHLPVDSIKIDKSFVEGLGQDPKDGLITSAMVSLAQTLGLDVVAEGVETVKQLRQLRKLGYDLAQGNYFSKPLTGEEASALVATEFQFKPG